MATNTNERSRKKPHENRKQITEFRSSSSGSEPRSRCLTCGKEINADVGRVTGDNDGNLPVCSRCWITPDNRSFQSDIRAIQAYFLDSGRRRDGADGPEHGRRRSGTDGTDNVAAGAGGTVPGGWDR